MPQLAVRRVHRADRDVELPYLPFHIGKPVLIPQ